MKALIHEMSKELTNRFDAIKTMDAIKWLKSRHPRTSLKDCLAAYKAAYE